MNKKRGVKLPSNFKKGSVKMKKIIVGSTILFLTFSPIFRWNLAEDKYKFSIIESIFREDIPTVEMVVGNIYDRINGN